MGARVMRFRSRKTVALVAYLALEPGLHARDKLADLLWPQSVDGTGRASLRTALAQINNEIGAQHGVLRSSREAVGWNIPDLGSDVRDLELASRVANRPDVTVNLESQLEMAANLWRGELLEGLALSDAPNFDDWLIARREIARGWLDGVLERLCRLYAESERVNLALEIAQRRVRLEPLNESAYRRLIELHVRSGNRTSALEAYQACRTVLASELGIEPALETSGLVESLGKAAVPRVTRSTPALSLERSTRLVGREREWALMEAAWQAGQAILLHGPPGVGKTRLMLEFAASKGSYLHCVGRPGDDLVPYGTHARTFKQVTDTFAPLDIPDWIRHELSRIIPSLGGSPSPISSEADKLRFFEAKAEILRLFFERGCAVLAYDDVQFVDPASVEAGWYTLAKFLPSQPGQPRSIHAYRTDEIPDRVKSMLHQALDAGIVVIIEVAPLEVEAVGELLEDLELGFPAEESLRLSDSMHRFTGGNPLFVLETVRALTGRGGLESLTAERFENRRRAAQLPRTPKVQAIIQRRFERLSAPAQDLARVAAVAGEYFTLELGAKVLETPILELSRSAMELEEAHVWRGLRFSHDLLFETTLENIPESFSSLLHGRVLDALEGSAVPVAVQAGHAFAANRWKEAFRYSLDAAEFARGVYAVREGIEHCERARQLVQNPPPGFEPRTDIDTDQVVRLYNALLGSYYTTNELEVMTALDQEMLEYARHTKNPSLECHALVHLASYQNERRFTDVERSDFLEAALRTAEDHGLEKDAARVQVGLVELDMNQRHFQTAIERGRRVLSSTREVNSAYVTSCLMWMAQAQLHSGDWQEAEISYRELLSLTDTRDWVNVAHYRLWLGHLAVNQARVNEGTELMRAATTTLVELLPADPYFSYNGGALLVFGLIDRGELSEAARVLERHRIRVEEHVEATLCLPIVKALLVLGQREPALDLALRGLKQNADMIGHSAFAPLYTDQLGSLACELEMYKGDWYSAARYAREAANARFKINGEVGENGSNFSRYLEIEALLRGGEIELARESVRRLGEFVGHYARRQIPYLRSLAVLEVFDGKLEPAIGHLLDAKDLMIPIGLPNERWTLEANLAELYEQNGDLEKAKEARHCALEIVNTLADSIPDEASRTVFLQFARTHVFRVERISS
jgi:DNA-binding SARP family transcriptional activator/tetratricopeptide (TPR) repeat protein